MAKTHGHKNYFSDIALNRGEATIRRTTKALRDVDFDTFVVTGMSGAVFGGMIARSMKKNLFVIRKDNDDSHDGNRPFGNIGAKWLFLDDFISTGDTFKFVHDAVTRRLTEPAPEWVSSTQSYQGDGYGIIGRYSYNNSKGTRRWTTQGFQIPEFAGVYQYGYNILYDQEEAMSRCKNMLWY